MAEAERKVKKTTTEMERNVLKGWEQIVKNRDRDDATLIAVEQGFNYALLPFLEPSS